MGRHSTMIPINGETFKNVVQSRRPLSSLEDFLDVSKQAINAWIAGNKIPPKKLSALTKELKLTPKELVSITQQNRERPAIVFKSTRNVEIEGDIKESVIQVAEEYFRLDDLLPEAGNEVIAVQIPDPVKMAEYIERDLGLQRGNIDIKQVINSLKKYNINVLFHYFDNHDIHAVCVKKKNKHVILINSNEFVEDVCWRVFHEVTHIFCGHTEHSKKDETFCNRVATEMVSPLSFYEKHNAFFKEHFGGPITTNQILIIDELTKKTGAGFFGIVLQLHKTKAIPTKNFSDFKRYWETKRMASSPKVRNIFISHEGEDILSHWNEILNDPDKACYLLFQNLILKGLIQERISFERASDLIGDLDIKTVQEVAEMWRRKLEYETHH